MLIIDADNDDVAVSFLCGISLAAGTDVDDGPKRSVFVVSAVSLLHLSFTLPLVLLIVYILLL